MKAKFTIEIEKTERTYVAVISCDDGLGCTVETPPVDFNVDGAGLSALSAAIQVVAARLFDKVAQPTPLDAALLTVNRLN